MKYFVWTRLEVRPTDAVRRTLKVCKCDLLNSKILSDYTLIKTGFFFPKTNQTVGNQQARTPRFLPCCNSLWLHVYLVSARVSVDLLKNKIFRQVCEWCWQYIRCRRLGSQRMRRFDSPQAPVRSPFAPFFFTACRKGSFFDTEMGWF